MKYRVVLLRLAVADLNEAYQWTAGRAPESAERWLTRFQSALATLSESPRRCSLAREHQKTAIELREMLFGRRQHIFRVIFTIDRDVVRILRIRRAQRRFLTSAQILEANDSD